MAYDRRPALAVAFLLAASVAAPAASQATKEQMAEAGKIVELVYPSGSYANTYRTAMLDLMAKQGETGDPERLRKITEVIDLQAAKLGQQQEPVVREAMAKVMIAKFSESELTAIRTFFESPAGRAYTKHMPAITAVLDSNEQTAATMVATEELLEKLEAVTGQ